MPSQQNVLTMTAEELRLSVVPMNVASTGTWSDTGEVGLDVWTEDGEHFETRMSKTDAVALATKLLRAADGDPNSYYVTAEKEA